MVRVGPNPITASLIKREKFGHRQTDEERISCDDEGRNWNGAFISQRMRRIANNHQKREERYEEDFPSESLEVPISTLI